MFFQVFVLCFYGNLFCVLTVFRFVLLRQMLKLMTNANVGGGFAKTLTKTEKLCRNTYFCAKTLTKRCFSDFSLTAHLELNSILDEEFDNLIGM